MGSEAELQGSLPYKARQSLLNWGILGQQAELDLWPIKTKPRDLTGQSTAVRRLSKRYKGPHLRVLSSWRSEIPVCCL